MKHSKSVVEAKLLDYISHRLADLRKKEMYLQRQDINDDTVFRQLLSVKAAILMLKDVRDAHRRFVVEVEKHGAVLPIREWTRMLTEIVSNDNNE